MAESNEGPTKPSGLELLQVSIPLTRVIVPIRPTKVKGIQNLSYQELKEERRQEVSKRAKTKKLKLGNPKRQLTIDDDYSSTPDDESMARTVGVRLLNGIIVSSTRANIKTTAGTQETGSPSNKWCLIIR